MANFDWTGFITYTGIGRVGTEHTSEIVERWVQKLDQPSFEEVVDLIQSRASPWVRSVKLGQPHTFVVAAFVAGVPTADVISNFGSPEWEQWGICDYITKPRVEAAITGKAPTGDDIQSDYRFKDEFPMADGFDENAELFTLTYETPLAVSHNLAFERVAPLLWMRVVALRPSQIWDGKRQNIWVTDRFR